VFNIQLNVKCNLISNQQWQIECFWAVYLEVISTLFIVPNFYVVDVLLPLLISEDNIFFWKKLKVVKNLFFFIEILQWFWIYLLLGSCPPNSRCILPFRSYIHSVTFLTSFHGVRVSCLIGEFRIDTWQVWTSLLSFFSVLGSQAAYSEHKLFWVSFLCLLIGS
jgi:hypothetical protein